MMKAVLLESELYNGAMTDLIEMRDVVKSECIDEGRELDVRYMYMFITNILNEFDEAAAVAGQNAVEEGTQFEIVNADPETYMDVELITESES